MESMGLVVLVVAFVAYTGSIFVLAVDRDDDKPGRVIAYAAAIALLVSTVFIFGAWLYMTITN